MARSDVVLQHSVTLPIGRARASSTWLAGLGSTLALVHLRLPALRLSLDSREAHTECCFARYHYLLAGYQVESLPWQSTYEL